MAAARPQATRCLRGGNTLGSLLNGGRSQLKTGLRYSQRGSVFHTGGLLHHFHHPARVRLDDQIAPVQHDHGAPYAIARPSCVNEPQCKLPRTPYSAAAGNPARAPGRSPGPAGDPEGELLRLGKYSMGRLRWSSASLPALRTCVARTNNVRPEVPAQCRAGGKAARQRRSRALAPTTNVFRERSRSSS